MKKVRLLCLHGWNSNKAVTAYQLNILSSPTSDIAEYVCINAPYKTEKQVDPMLAKRFEGPFYSWMDIPRFKKEGNGGYLEAAIAVAKVWNEEGPFDGLLGFS